MIKQKLIRILSTTIEELENSIGPITYNDKAEILLNKLRDLGVDVEECYACSTACGEDHCYFTDTGV